MKHLFLGKSLRVRYSPVFLPRESRGQRSLLGCCPWDLKESDIAEQLTHSSVQLLSSVHLFVTPWTAALQASCPSPAPGVYSNSCPSSQWCHPTISLSVIPFSSRLQSLPASGSFQMSLLFTSGGQSIGVPASASVLPMNIQDWFPFGLTGWISL